MAHLATPPRSLLPLDAAPFIAPVSGAYMRTARREDGPARVAIRRRARAERPSVPLVDVTTQICWWAALATGLTCSIVPVISRGALVPWLAAVVTMAANTALCLAGALQVTRRDRLDAWTGLIACSGAAFALVQAVRLAGIVVQASIAPTERLEVVGLFLLSTVYAALATAGAWIRDLNSKVVTR